MENVALVTGAYKGLGLEFCRQLGKKGYKVILTAREIQMAQVAVETLNEQNHFVFPKLLQVTDETQIKEMLDVIHINSIAPLLVVKHFRPLLQRSDKPIVINISSWLGSVTNLTLHKT